MRTDAFCMILASITSSTRRIVDGYSATPLVATTAAAIRGSAAERLWLLVDRGSSPPTRSLLLPPSRRLLLPPPPPWPAPVSMAIVPSYAAKRLPLTRNARTSDGVTPRNRPLAPALSHTCGTGAAAGE